MGNSDLSLVERTARSLERLGVRPDDTLLVGVSGGVDSMSLAHVLIKLHNDKHFARLAVAHVNHGLRVESDGDEAHVREFASEHKLKFCSVKVDTRSEAERSKKGIEETARDIRYRFFEECATAASATFVVTAHTANDQAETLIMNMMRGTGVRGLAGIPATRRLDEATLIRPWLEISREEIEAYAGQKGLAHRHDSSNDELLYTRNRVRHLVMPALKAAFPHRDALTSLGRLAEHMTELEQFLSTMTSEKLEALADDNGLRLSGLQHLSGLPLKIVLEAWLERHLGYYRLSADDSNRVKEFLSGEATSMELHGNVRLMKRDGLLVLWERSVAGFEPQHLTPGQSLETPFGVIRMSIREGNDFTKDRYCAFLDADVISASELTIRSWKEGDRIEPMGMRGRTKLVSDILNEAGIVGDKKQVYPVIIEGKEILWVPGVRGSEKAKISAKTERMIVLEFKPEH